MSRVAVVLGPGAAAANLAPLVAQLEARLGRSRVLLVGSGNAPGRDADVTWGSGFVPDHQLESVGSAWPGSFALAVGELGQYFEAENPAAVIVQGSSDAAAGAAVAAKARGIPLICVGAGVREPGTSPPDLVRGVLIDHLADVCCVDSELSAENLSRERVDDDRIMVADFVDSIASWHIVDATFAMIRALADPAG